MHSTLSRFVSTVCLCALLCPIAASAAPAAKQLTFPELIKIIQANKQPGAYSFDIKGTYDSYSASVSVKGTHNGEAKSLKKAAVDLTATLNVKGDGQTLKAVLDARLVNAVAYLRLREVTMTGRDDYDIEAQVEPYLNVWISFPIEEKYYEEYRDSAKKERLNTAEQWGKFLSLTTVQRGNNWRTTVTLPKSKKQRFLMMLASVGEAGLRANPELRRSLRATNIDLTMMVDTLAGKSFSTADLLVKIKTTAEKKTATLNVTAKSQVQKNVPAITAPAGSKTWEEVMEGQINASLSDVRNAQRKADVNTIMNAYYQYVIDNNGKIPGSFESKKTYAICKTEKPCVGIDLDILTGSYLVKIPSDPLADYEGDKSGYTFSYDRETQRLTIAAPLAEGGTISITR